MAEMTLQTIVPAGTIPSTAHLAVAPTLPLASATTPVSVAHTPSPPLASATTPVSVAHTPAPPLASATASSAPPLASATASSAPPLASATASSAPPVGDKYPWQLGRPLVNYSEDPIQNTDPSKAGFIEYYQFEPWRLVFKENEAGSAIDQKTGGTINYTSQYCQYNYQYRPNMPPLYGGLSFQGPPMKMRGFQWNDKSAQGMFMYDVNAVATEDCPVDGAQIRAFLAMRHALRVRIAEITAENATALNLHGFKPINADGTLNDFIMNQVMKSRVYDPSTDPKKQGKKGSNPSEWVTFNSSLAKCYTPEEIAGGKVQKHEPGTRLMFADLSIPDPEAVGGARDFEWQNYIGAKSVVFTVLPLFEYYRFFVGIVKSNKFKVRGMLILGAEENNYQRQGTAIQRINASDSKIAERLAEQLAAIKVETQQEQQLAVSGNETAVSSGCLDVTAMMGQVTGTAEKASIESFMAAQDPGAHVTLQ